MKSFQRSEHLCGVRSTDADVSIDKAFELEGTPGTWHHALLNNNEPPEGSELALIQSVISKADERLTPLDDEKSKLEEQLKQLEFEGSASDNNTILTRSNLQEKLNQLEKDRTSLSSYLARNRAILSPLRRMPPELLGEIFLWTLVSSNRGILAWGKFDMIIPWVLTWVCSRWRAVALSSPSLWSLVVIDYSSDIWDPLSSRLFPFVDALIQRSQKLRIHFYGYHGIDSHRQVQMLELLSRHASRWEELSIGMISELVPLLTTLRDRLTSLERLWIQWDGPESQTVESIDCFRSAPALVDFGTYNEYRFVPIAHPIHQLTRYQLDGPWKKHKEILKLAPNLVEARIEPSFDQQERWPDPEEIAHLSLRRLYVSDAELLNFLILPALEELALWVEDDGIPDILPILESFLVRSACPLRRLCLRGFPNAHTTTKLLQRFPFITELVIAINDTAAYEKVQVLMQTLTMTEKTKVAPQLRCLFFGCEDETCIDYGVYLQMLRSRWQAEDCALKTAALFIDKGPRPSRATRRGLHALRQGGLDFVLGKGPQARNEIHVWAYAASWN